MEQGSTARRFQEELFLTTDETFRDAIGNKRATMALSNRRVYLKYEYWLVGKGERSVDLQDVTGVSYGYVNPVFLLIIAAVVLLAGLIAAVWVESLIPFLVSIPVGLMIVIIYLLCLRTVLRVEYAGAEGLIGLAIRGDACESARDFFAQLRFTKDELLAAEREENPFQ